MKHDIHQQYPDLLNKQDDTTLVNLVHDLDTTYRLPQPPAKLNWVMLKARHALAETNTQHVLRMPRSLVRKRPLRIGLVLVASLVMIVLGGSVLANTPLLDQLLNQESHTSAAMLGCTDVHQPSQRVGDFTVGVKEACADVNRIIIGITFNHGGYHYYLNESDIALCLVQGARQCSDLPSYGLYTGTDLWTDQYTTAQGPNSQGAPKSGGALFTFDAATIQGNPKAVNLHLSIPYGKQYTVGNQKAPEYKKIGVFTFDFSAVFHKGRVAQVHRSITLKSNLFGTVTPEKVTLEKVVVTKSEVRAYMSYTGFKQGLFKAGDVLCFSVGISSLSVDGRTYVTNNGYTSDTRADFLYPLYGKSGLWTFVVQRRVVQQSSNYATPILTSDATFSFRVPAA